MRILIFLAVIFLSGAAAATAETRLLRIVSTNYEPFTGIDLPGGGIVNRSVQRIAADAGFSVEVVYEPWARAIESTRRGHYDATSYGYYNPDRDVDFIQVGPFTEERIIFLVRADSEFKNWDALQDLAGLRIGVVLGYTYSKEFWDLGESGVLTFSDAQSDEGNLRKLLAGRIDIFPISADVGQHMISQIFSEEEQAQLLELEKPLTTTGSFLLVSRNIDDAEIVAQSLQSVIDAERSTLTN